MTKNPSFTVLMAAAFACTIANVSLAEDNCTRTISMVTDDNGLVHPHVTTTCPENAEEARTERATEAAETCEGLAAAEAADCALAISTAKEANERARVVALLAEGMQPAQIASATGIELSQVLLIQAASNSTE